MSEKDLDVFLEDLEVSRKESLERLKEKEKEDLKPEWNLIKLIWKTILYFIIGFLIFLLIFEGIKSYLFYGGFT